MLPNTTQPPLLCTFHKFGLLFLKFHIKKLGRDANFAIIDTDDKKKIIKRFNDDITVNMVQNYISSYKNSAIDPVEAALQADSDIQKQIAEIYAKYEAYLEQNNLVDFDDLLLLPYIILKNFEDVRVQTSMQYQYIMVDEYQDTNSLQFDLLKLITGTTGNLCVVGDDDQSIYSFRGAKIENILRFEEMFTNVKIVALTKNYRSVSSILEAANAVIINNRSRHQKSLESVRGGGEKVVVKRFEDERYEADWLASSVKTLLSKGIQADDIAILFRVSALSRALEDGFRKANIPYKFISGMKFYERSEIKDALAYLRLASNPYDNFSFLRVVNRPRRGIGETSIAKLNAYARGSSFYELLTNPLVADELRDGVGKKAFTQLNEFVKIINNLILTKKNEGTFGFLDEFERIVGLRKFFADTMEEDRVYNLDEFYAGVKERFKNSPDSEIEDFLNEISLQGDQDNIQGGEVPMMTIHASKGLEFSRIFVIGAEEGFFPIDSGSTDIEEERRLCYVAMTRAKDVLTLCVSKSRFHNGKRELLNPSRFLKEAGLIDDPISTGKSASKWNKNDLVKHKIFGFGRVIEVIGANENTRLRINFGGSIRDILASFVESAI
jgi:DNA helicase-2/ATP-dependent DNA helicase PcrA